ncbi:hypothetical protein FA09DRAFT_219826 [Tilletiopsis washingtonensis]|uniref:Uncharacterized protein n=1 Tax=Tilletiopsis washingtonensis TaxID=58919 RepID=A0A316ZDL1_9BASI|nr:hypothetical protein FA09DRAFT_219826 [Tilletiopsis washingtonensis]PWN99800.1 hypothetical protein FA09DRAFT_219826 [Tilletiopsis washingtonensis]
MSARELLRETGVALEMLSRRAARATLAADGAWTLGVPSSTRVIDELLVTDDGRETDFLLLPASGLTTTEMHRADGRAVGGPMAPTGDVLACGATGSLATTLVLLRVATLRRTGCCAGSVVRRRRVPLNAAGPRSSTGKSSPDSDSSAADWLARVCCACDAGVALEMRGVLRFSRLSSCCLADLRRRSKSAQKRSRAARVTHRAML